MRQADLKRVLEAGVWKQGVDSDHKAIFLKLELAQKLMAQGSESRTVRQPKIA